MREVYAVTDVLLVPSQFTEAFGRVIVEAQLNGIPVVAADAGGIPYALGEGGLLVRPKDSPSAYADAIRRLRTEDGLRAKLSERALRNTRRPELEPEGQVDEFVRLVTA
jgi:glycosyltransferase involved in cell wall biosynthesis